MALLGTGVSTKYWQAPINISTTAVRPIWLSMWINIPAGASGGGVTLIPASGIFTAAAIGLRPSGTNTFLIDKEDGGTGQTASAATGIGTGVWQHQFGQFDSSTRRLLYAGGVSKLTNTSGGNLALRLLGAGC